VKACWNAVSAQLSPTVVAVTVVVKTANRTQLTRVAATAWLVAAAAYLVVEKVAAANVKGHYSYLHN
jgi:hypothetical protein